MENDKQQLEKTGKMFQEKYPLSSEILKSSIILSKRLFRIFIKSVITVIILGYLLYGSFYFGGPIIGIIVTLCVIYFVRFTIKEYKK